MHGLAQLIQSYGPWLIGVVVALEATGLPLPAESILIATAAYAGTSHKLGIVWIIVPAAIGAIVGDNFGFLIGRTIGWRVLRRWGRHIGLSDDRLLLGAYLFRRHGGKVVFFGRFVVLLRTVAALLAGANRMEWRWFLPNNAAGGIAWTCIYALGAYALGKAATHIATPAAIGLGVVAVAVLGTGFWTIRRHEEELIEKAKKEMGPADQALTGKRERSGPRAADARGCQQGSARG